RVLFIFFFFQAEDGIRDLIVTGVQTRAFRSSRLRIHEPHDPRRAGIGLGLPIARRLVDAQAGRMWIEDGPGGRGTSVVVVLPAGVEAAQPERAPEMAASAS